MKDQFPIFQKHPNLAYLDNAATTQRPASVIQAISNFNSFENANIHRGIYDLSNQATSKYEAVRARVADFLGLGDSNNIAFTSGTTESINIIARCFLENRLHSGDNVVISLMEHHANFIPWQVLSKEKGAELRIIPILPSGDLDIDAYLGLVDRNTKMVAINHISNTLGTVNDMGDIINIAHDKQLPVLVDAAQSASLYEIDFQPDFLTFSAHKAFGPFGVGVLYADEKYHDEIKPYNVGGGMIRHVSVEETDFAKYPLNLDAGTPNIDAVVGLGAALEFMESMDRPTLRKQLSELTDDALEKLRTIREIKIIGQPRNRSAIVSFMIEDIHPHDVASFLNKDGIAVRAGMHCTQPLLESMGHPATVRASFSIYNTREEADRLVASLKALIAFWS